MNNKLFIIRNILFILVIIPLFYLSPYVKEYNNVWQSIFFIFSLVIISLLVLINIIRKQKTVNYNNQYNKIFILTIIFTLIILFKVYFNPYFLEYNKPYFINEVYFATNSLYISIAFFSLSINNLILIYTN